MNSGSENTVHRDLVAASHPQCSPSVGLSFWSPGGTGGGGGAGQGAATALKGLLETPAAFPPGLPCSSYLIFSLDFESWVEFYVHCHFLAPDPEEIFQRR